MTWDEIRSDYETFENCVFSPDKHKGIWKRDDKKGREYLLKSYIKSQLMPEKDHLLYARILFNMYRAFECKKDHLFSLIDEGDGFLAESKKQYHIVLKKASP
jgi:hypothetical protein